MKRRDSWLVQGVRFALILVTGGYTLGLALYLILRLLFGDRFWWLALLNNLAPYLFLPLPVALVLAFASRGRRLTVLAAALALIGIFWFGPRFWPKAQPAPNGPMLRVVTFNVWGGNPHLDTVETWLRQVNADLVLLQENPKSYADDGIPHLKDLYPYQLNRAWQWGNIALSRYPILTEEHFDLANDGSRPVQQRFTVGVGGRTIAIYNVHLPMPIGDRPRLPGVQYLLQTAARYDDSARNSEIERVIAVLKTEPYPFVVAGDFNMSDQAAIYSRLAALMGDTFREAGFGLGGSWPLGIVDELPSFLPPLFRIDYIWHSAHFRAIDAWQGPRLGSDHLPLYGALELLSDKP